MRALTKWVAFVALGAVIVILGARTFGGEVATPYTTDNSGKTHRTRLWVVGDGTNVWIRSTAPTSPWLDRLINHPKVELRRGDVLTSYKATPATHRRTPAIAAEVRLLIWLSSIGYPRRLRQTKAVLKVVVCAVEQCLRIILRQGIEQGIAILYRIR